MDEWTISHCSIIEHPWENKFQCHFWQFIPVKHVHIPFFPNVPRYTWRNGLPNFSIMLFSKLSLPTCSSLTNILGMTHLSPKKQNLRDLIFLVMLKWRNKWSTVSLSKHIRATPICNSNITLSCTLLLYIFIACCVVFFFSPKNMVSYRMIGKSMPISMQKH